MTLRHTLSFDDMAALQATVGPHNAHLEQVAAALGLHLRLHNGGILMEGPEASVQIAATVLNSLYQRAQAGRLPEAGDVDAALRLARSGNDPVATQEALVLQTRRRRIEPKSPGQVAYIKALRRHNLVFGLGPAGTGKTYLAVAHAVTRLLEGAVDRLILSRPAVEAGERLGFLPGDLRDKVDPYLRPLYDALHDCLPDDRVIKGLERGEIEVAPLAFMRGRTLDNAAVILDEAQNTTPMQMKMFLTRLGANSHMVVTGDLTQVDLPPGAISGLTDAMATLEGTEGVAFVPLSEKDVIRHPLVARIIAAYDRRARVGATSE